MKKIVISLLLTASLKSMDQLPEQLLSAKQVMPLLDNNKPDTAQKQSENIAAAIATDQHKEIEDSENYMQRFFTYLHKKNKAGETIKLPTRRAREELQFFASLDDSVKKSDGPLEITQFSCNLCHQPFNSQIAYRKHAKFCFGRKNNNRQMHMITKKISKRKNELLKKTEVLLTHIDRPTTASTTTQPLIAQ